MAFIVAAISGARPRRDREDSLKTEVFVRVWDTPTTQGKAVVTRYRTDGSRIGEYLGSDGHWYPVREFGVLPDRVFLKLED